MALAPIHLYTILTQSKQMGSYKWFLLNHSVWCIALEIFLTITKPIPLLPSSSFISGNFLIRIPFGHSVTVFFFGTFLYLLILSIGGVSMSLVYRYGNVFPGKISKLIASKNSMFVYILAQLFLAGLVIIFILPLCFMDRKEAIDIATTEYPALINLTAQPTFTYLIRSRIEMGVLMCIFIMIALLVFFTVFSVFLVYKVKKTNTQILNSKTQWTLIKSVIAQVVVTILFLFLPTLPMYISFQLEIPYSGPFMVYCFCIVSLHSLVEMIVTLIFVLPYRRFIVLKTAVCLKWIFKNMNLSVKVTSDTKNIIEAATPAGICPDGTIEDTNNHACFKFVSDRKTFSDAEDSCFSMGGHLAVVESMFTNNFLAENAGNLDSNDFWIGANVYTDISSKPWVWTDSYKLVVYSDWAKGQPSGGQCAAVSVLDGTWKAVDCTLTKPYICGIPRAVYACPSEWTYLESTKSCYKVYPWAIWSTAESTCVSEGAHLASLHSAAENNFANYLAQYGNTGTSDDRSQETWIGFYTESDDNSDYKWSDGSPVDYTNWKQGDPDEPGKQKCCVMYANGQYDNRECENSVRYYICKKPATAVNL